MHIKRIIFLLLFLFISTAINAQIELSGVIKDSIAPIAYASVVVKDSTEAVVAYDITDENGSFVLDVPKGNYKMVVSILGYQDWQQAVSLRGSTNLEPIVLSASTEQLDEVVVTKRIPLIERKADRLVFNVENSIAASGGNALDALRVAPGVNVEKDAISMLGKGQSRIMIDGRILQLTGEEMVNFLNSIASEDIKSIEIITNPPAKYEAAGGGGLINIVYKKGAGDFWKNSISLAYNQNTYSFFNIGNTLIYNKNKVKLSLSLNGSVGDIRFIEVLETNYPTGPWAQNLNTKQQRDNLSNRFAIDYDITEKTTLGIQYLGNLGQPDLKDRTITFIRDRNNSLDSIYDSSGSNDRSVDSHIFNLHVISQLDTLGTKLSFDLDYFDYDNELERTYFVNALSPTKDFLNINQAAINLSNQFIDNYSAKVDVEQPLKFLRLSYGAKLSFIKTANDLRTLNTISGEPILDPSLSDEFEYKENIQAIYLNGEKEIKDKLVLQGGVRLENTITEAFSRSLNEVNKNDYLKFFPTFYMSYKKNDQNSFSFNYGRRIERPSFRDLNPFRFFTNSNSYSEGNPFLLPSFTDNFEFYHTYKQVLTSNLFYGITSDGFGTVLSPDTENNVQAIIRRNYYRSYRGGITETYTYDKIPWWQSQNQLSITGFKADFDNDLDAIPQNGFQLYLDTKNTFSIGETTKLQVDFFYSTPYKILLFDFEERYGLDIGLRKTFLNNNLQLSFLINDIFDTGSRNLMAQVNGVELNFASNYSRRFFRASLSYNFGNNKINVKERNFGNDAERRRTN